MTMIGLKSKSDEVYIVIESDNRIKKLKGNLR